MRFSLARLSVPTLLATAIPLGCNFPPPPDSAAAATVIGTPFPATVTINVASPGRLVNRLVLGNNIQWVDNADGLLRPGTTEFDPRMLEYVKQLRPTVLRYPGGSQADVYMWRAGVGPASQRGQSEHFHRRQAQRVLFGTAEFLSLCKLVGAEPLITVNVATSSETDAAAWVGAVNKGQATRPPLGRVKYWEIGNEPYLRDDQHKELGMAPEEYARRADRFIRAMKQTDPSIYVGIPLRSDQIGGVTAVHYPKFAETVLAMMQEPFDFVALHDAYLPVLFEKKAYTAEDVFRASMAAFRVVEQDFEFTRALLRKYKPGRPIRFAVTEYNALYTISGQLDDHIATLGGALYLADVLRLFAGTTDVMMANYWSLSGNWYFGAVSSDGQLRPAYHVLRAYEQLLRGRLLPLTVESPTFDNPRVGAVPALQGTPLIAGLATREGSRVRLLLINKDPTRPVLLTIGGPMGTAAATEFKELSDTNVFAARSSGGLQWAPRPVTGGAFPFKLTIDPHALAWIEFDLAT